MKVGHWLWWWLCCKNVELLRRICSWWCRSVSKRECLEEVEVEVFLGIGCVIN